MGGRSSHIKRRLLGSALFKDSAWALIGNVLGKGLALLASIIVARLLGKDLFGTYGLVRTTLLNVAIFSTFGLGYTATKFIADFATTAPGKVRGIINNILSITITSSLIIAAFVFAFSKSLAEYLNDPTLYLSLRYLSVIIIFNAITTTQIGVLSGFKKFKALARINLLNGVVTFILSVVLTYFYALNGALIALIISQVYNCIQNSYEVKRSVAEYPHQATNNTKEIVQFSLPIAMQEMVYSLTSFLLPVILVRLSSIGELGLYNAASQWTSVVLFIPGTLRNVILSHISGDVTNKEHQHKTVERMLWVNLASTLAPFLVVYLFTSLIVSMYGDTFAALGDVLRIGVFSTIFICMSNVITQYFIALNKVWLTFTTRLLRDSLIIILTAAGLRYLPNFSGAIIVSYVTVIVSVIVFVIYFVLYRLEAKSK